MSIIGEFPDEARNLLVVRGRDLLDTLGLPALRTVVSQVLCGVNIRSATESLTKRRISLLNAAILTTYTNLAQRGMAAGDIPSAAYTEYKKKSTTAEDKIVLRWMLGLTTKQVQNVLRSDDSAWADYVESLKESISSSAETAEEDFGPLPLGLAGKSKQELDWEWALSLLMAIGSQTLAIRGSEKSLYGKFFEKMIMGSVLSVLGFTLTEEDSPLEESFWLSSRGRKRESDATAIWKSGEGVRFDIGFIGVGNPEITLDKVSRFEREMDLNGVPHSMRTIIIVDRVGKNSRIIELAIEIDGRVIQMSSSNWAKSLGQELEDALPGYRSPLRGLSHSAYVKAIEDGVALAPLEKIFKIAVSGEEETPEEIDEE
ncbi:MAG: CfrBI family restriction endonuclease [Actinobacteria bacterium]|nr:CfrBI family restriction endonuclease [Actinomycetota bacterium]